MSPLSFALLLATACTENSQEEPQMGSTEAPLTLDLTRADKDQTKIWGGAQVKDHAYPWAVAIVDKTGKLVCGGTLIAPSWVLSARHCAIRKGDYVLVGSDTLIPKYVGQYRRVSEVQCPPVGSGPVTSLEPCPAVAGGAIEPDFALVRLDQPADPPAREGQWTFPQLAEQGHDLQGDETLRVLGWGRTGSGSKAEVSARLKTAEVRPLDRSVCATAVQIPSAPPSWLCAEAVDGGSCIRDSGGPVFIEGSPPTIVGVVTGGTSATCDNDGSRMVFGRVGVVSELVKGEIGP
jgi:secreted trypsin-like serine protease